MKTSQAETSHAAKRDGRRFWIGCFTLLLSLPLLYYGYCWGLWGRHSLLLQYLFQCNCPAASEEARYPKEVDVIVPACHYVSSMLSPSGRLLYVEEKKSGLITTYLLDLQTQEKTPFFVPEGSNHFLTDDLLFLSLYYGHGYEGGEYILDRTTGKQYPILDFAYWRSDTYLEGKANLSVLAHGLREAEDVFLIDNDMIAAFASDFHTAPEHNFYVQRAAFPGREADRAERFLKQNNIAYHFIPNSFPSEAFSPNERFIARADGIYLTETGQKIVAGYSANGWFHSYSGKDFSVRGWISDNTGVIYSKFLNPCLIESSFLLSDEPGCLFAVSQPVLKLKVPEEFLLPRETP